MLIVTALLLAAAPPLTDHGCHLASADGAAVYCVSHYQYAQSTAEAALVRLSPRPTAHRVRAAHQFLYEGDHPLDARAAKRLKKSLDAVKPPLVKEGLVALDANRRKGKATRYASPDGNTVLEIHDSWEKMAAVSFRAATPDAVSRIRLAGDPDAPWAVNTVWWVKGSRTFAIEVMWKPERPEPDFRLETGVFFLRAPGD